MFDKIKNSYATDLRVVQFLLILISCLLFRHSGLASDAQLNWNQHSGHYVITPNGEVGRLGSRMSRNKIYVNLVNKNNNMPRIEAYLYSDLQYSLETSNHGPEEKTLAPGDYVSVILDKESSKDDGQRILEKFFIETLPEGTTFMQVEALFRDKVLLRPVQISVNSKVQLSSNYLFNYKDIDKHLASHDILKTVSTETGKLTADEFSWMARNMDTYILCLEQNYCDFKIKVRQFNDRKPGPFEFSWFGKMTKTRELVDVQITSRDQFLRRLNEQAIQFKIMTGLAHAEELAKKNKAYKNVGNSYVDHGYIHLKPLQGMDAVPFKVNGPYVKAVETIVTNDVGGMRDFVGALLRQGGFIEKNPKNIFGTSTTTSRLGVKKNKYYHDTIQPLYEVFLHEYAQTQSYLAYLDWTQETLDADHFVKAMKKVKKEALLSKKMILDLEGDDQFFALSFVINFERTIDDYDLHQQELVRALLEVESQDQTFWRSLVSEVKKPAFWGILGCYGVTVFTPVKFMNLICHAAGLSIVGEGLLTNLKKTKRYYHLQKTRMIPSEIYYDAVYGLAVESVLGLFFLKTAMPDFLRASPRGLWTNTTPGATQAAIGAQGSVLKRQGVKATYGHAKETLQKMLAGLAFSGQQASDAIMSQFLGGKTVEDMTMQRGSDLFMDDIMSVGYLMTLVLELPLIKTWDTCRSLDDILPDSMSSLSAEELEMLNKVKRLQKEMQCVDHAPPFAVVNETNKGFLRTLRPSGRD